MEDMENERINTYDEVINPSFYNQKIKIECSVIGKSISPYHIPKVLTVKCISPKCNGCPIRDDTEITIDAGSQSILQLIDISTTKMQYVLVELLGLHCKNITYDVKEMQSIERIYITRPTGKERSRGGGTRPAFLLGTTVETNCSYLMEGYTTVEPNTQSATHVFLKAQKRTNDIESFNLIHKYSALNEFCVSDRCGAEVIFDKLQQLYTTYSHNVTKIYERFDLHLCVDLLFRSVISFKFDNEYVHKGWLDVMIVGDPRCGKGYVAEKLADYFGLGEVCSGENCSIPGLIGGVQQISGHWIITWGKIVQNDMQLLIVDETGGFQEENIWGKLSRIRSEGVAEITKIQTETANARTRLLWLCNPKDRVVANYMYGIQCINDLVSAPEDLARFDFALVVAHNEVSGDVINQRREQVPKLYNQSLEQDLVLWCWSRKSNEVKFSREATKSIYETSMRLDKIYDFSIPLIQVENVRFKIAKIAIAFAARLYSNAENGRVLVVKAVHVECAFAFFNMIYGKDASGYKAFSTMKKSVAETVTTEKLNEVEVYFDSWKLQKRELMRYFLLNNTVDVDSMQIHLGVRKEECIECMSRLLKAGCLNQRGRFYIKGVEFSRWIKDKILKK